MGSRILVQLRETPGARRGVRPHSQRVKTRGSSHVWGPCVAAPYSFPAERNMRGPRLALVALFRTFSAAIQGIDAHVVDVEVDMYPSGTSAISSRWACRIRPSKKAGNGSNPRSSIRDFGYPTRSVTINLAPANVRKEGAGFDLPMAIAILGAMGGSALRTIICSWASYRSTAACGRYGARCPSPCAPRSRGIRNLLVPVANAAEAAVAEGVRVFGLRHLERGGPVFE